MNEPTPQDKPNIIGWGIFVILVAAIIYYAVNIMNNPSTARINVITFEYVVDDDIIHVSLSLSLQSQLHCIDTYRQVIDCILFVLEASYDQ